MIDTDYLNKERELLWQELNRIKEKDLKNIMDKLGDLSKTIPQDVAELKSYKASIEHLKGVFKQYQAIYDDIVTKCKLASNQASSIFEAYEKIENIKKELNEINKNVIQLAQNIQTALNENQDLPNIINKTNESIELWNVTYKQASKQAKEIKEVHTEIFGGEYEDENGKIQKVEGSLKELNTAYDDLKRGLEQLEQDTKNTYEAKFQEWDAGYSLMKEKIKELLPGAMQAGLASAFIEKRKREENERKNTYIVFYISIAFLVFISILPVCFNLSLIKFENQLALIENIKIMASIIWAMLPIYIPILWVAIFSNKKINLSKKLIEEYSYKEAVAKTYEGLSTQIQSLDDEDEISKNLKERLINITLNANADNPGKYINNYDKSDNPILDILNNKNLLKIIEKDNWKDILERICNFISSKNNKSQIEHEKG